jgi:hypothetical protein
MTIVSFMGNTEIAILENHCEAVGIEPSLKLYPTQTDYSAFLSRMVAKNASVFVKPLLDISKSRALAITPIGVLEAEISELPLIMPSVPEFSIGPPEGGQVSPTPSA